MRRIEIRDYLSQADHPLCQINRVIDREYLPRQRFIGRIRDRSLLQKTVRPALLGGTDELSVHQGDFCEGRRMKAKRVPGSFFLSPGLL
jgi:hypothetical protein